MASNGVDPITGAPRFPETDAPAIGADYQEVADFAASVGSQSIGTSAARLAYPYARKGFGWYDTTLDQGFVHDGSNWLLSYVPPFSSSVTFVGIYSSSGASPVSVRVENGRAFLEGIAVSTNIGFTPGTNYTLGSVPASIAPSEDQLYVVSAGSQNSARLVIQASGTIIFAVMSAFTAPLSMGLGSVNWRVG
jgi:hypothetical protein